MKKLSILILLFLGLSLEQSLGNQITITNSSDCGVRIKLYAHDGTYTSCCYFQSYTIYVSSMASPLVISSPDNLNLCSPVCWGWDASSGGTWDMAGVQIEGEDCFKYVGPSGTCSGYSANSPQVIDLCSCCVKATWDVLPGGNISLTIVNNACAH